MSTGFSIRSGVVFVGPDEALPRAQPVTEWRSGVLLADLRAVPPEVRARCGLRLPDEERREDEVEAREIGIAPHRTERDLWRERARLLPVTEDEARHLAAEGSPPWDAGYRRHTMHLWAGRWGTARSVPLPGAGTLVGPALQAFDATRIDRLLRALTSGEVTEAALSFARRCGMSAGWPPVSAPVEPPIEGDELLLPDGRRAHRLVLPAFTIPLFAEQDGLPRATGEVLEVPAAKLWCL